MDAASIESVNLHLSALPRLQLAVKVEADEGDSDVQQGDIGHCRVRYVQPKIRCNSLLPFSTSLLVLKVLCIVPNSCQSLFICIVFGELQHRRLSYVCVSLLLIKLHNVPACCICLQVRVLLSRPSHRSEGFSLRGSAVRAYTPYNPVPRDESWYFFLVDPNNNAIWTWQKVGRGGGGHEGCGVVLRLAGGEFWGVVRTRSTTCPSIHLVVQ